MEQCNCVDSKQQPWNGGKLVGQKAPLRLKEICAIRVRLQPPLGHSKLESTVRHLGIEVDGTLEMAEQTEVQSETARRPREALG